jgi:hypothetical protein
MCVAVNDKIGISKNTPFDLTRRIYEVRWRFGRAVATLDAAVPGPVSGPPPSNGVPPVPAANVLAGVGAPGVGVPQETERTIADPGVGSCFSL